METGSSRSGSSWKTGHPAVDVGLAQTQGFLLVEMGCFFPSAKQFLHDNETTRDLEGFAKFFVNLQKSEDKWNDHKIESFFQMLLYRMDEGRKAGEILEYLADEDPSSSGLDELHKIIRGWFEETKQEFL